MNLGGIGNVPISFAVAPSGYLFMASGSGPMIKWDGLADGLSQGLTTAYYNVGVFPPATGFNAAGFNTGGPNLTGAYVAYMRYVDKDGNFSNAFPLTGVAFTLTNAFTVQYTNLEVPSANGTIGTGNQDATKYVRRQILRSTAGETATFYIDIDTNDVTSTTLYSDSTTVGADGNVGTGGNTTGAVAGNADGGTNGLNTRIATSQTVTQLFLYGVPPQTPPFVAMHLGRMFAAGIYLPATVTAEVVNGSTTVNLIHTSAGTAFIGRILYVGGGLTPYTITNFGTRNVADTTSATLTISPAYKGPSDNFAQVNILPAQSVSRTVYYSQSLQPDAWPATNSVNLNEDGDTVSGLVPFGSFLYILEKRHIYRFTYETDPASDGFIFLVQNRGCVNNRCWVAVEGNLYLMDEQGIYAYSGGPSAEPVSNVIQDVFRFSDSPFRVVWANSQWFHCVHYSSQETIRWFVTLAGQLYPYHAIAYNYRQQRWWIEEWATPVASSALGRLANGVNTPQVFLGGAYGRVLAMWQGPLDGPDPTAGRVHGPCTPAGSYIEIVDPTGSAINTYPSKGVVNNPVCIVDGTGKGQRNIVVGVLNTSAGGLLTTKYLWRIRPDATSVYQLGGIQWRVQFGWWRWIYGEDETERVFTVIAQSCKAPTIMSANLFTDFGTTPVVWTGPYSLNDGNGVRTQAGNPDIDYDLTKVSGYWEKRIPNHREFFVDGVRYVSWKLFGVSNADFQRIYYIMLTGADQG